MHQDNCPDLAAIRRFLLGQFVPTEAAPLEAHLLHCRRCIELAGASGGGDALLDAMRAQRTAAAEPHGELIEQLIGRLEALSVSGTPNVGGTVAEADGRPLAGPETEVQSPQQAEAARRASVRTTERPLIPSYEILGELGRGGMGVVYKARQTALNRLVALKMILAGAHAGAGLVSRFRAEAETVARLKHPHIVQVYEVGEAGGLPYCALEFCDGGSLAERLRDGPLPAGEAAQVTAKLAGAMHAAHQAGVVHRDLKPANVLLTADGSPKVTDFGLAKCLDAADGQTRSGDLLGTPSYMAPEQARGSLKEIGPATDVYALGAILYELLTGRPPFRAATVMETLDLVRNTEPLPPRQLQPKCPRDLEIICLKCLRKEPGKRYARALELAEDLRRFQNGEPIRARPVHLLERAVKWVRRRPALAGLAALVLLSVTALLALSFWYVRNLGLAQGETAVARAVAEEREYFRLFSQVRERRAEPQPGWTWSSLDDLRQAALLPAAAAHLAELRSEAASALVAIDVRRRAVVGEKVNAACLAFAPDGRRLALGQAKIWAPLLCPVVLVDPAGKEKDVSLSFKAMPVWNPKAGLVQDGAEALAFSPDGRWLVASARSGMLHRWDLKRQPPALVSWTGHKSGAEWLAFSPDGTALFSASSGEMTVKRWTVAEWDKPQKDPRPDRVSQEWGRLLGLAVHPVQGWVACSALGADACLSPDTLQPLRPTVDRGMGQIQFAPDGLSLVYEADGVIHFLNLTNNQVLRQLQAPASAKSHDGVISALALNRDGTLLVSASQATKHVRLWEVAGGRLLADLFVGGGTVRPAFAPDGRTLAVTTDKGTALYDIGGLREQRFVAVQPHPVHSVALDPAGSALACLSQSIWEPALGDVTVWPLREGEAAAGPHPALTPAARHTFPGYLPPEVERHSLTFQPGGRLLAYGKKDCLAFSVMGGASGSFAMPGLSDTQSMLSFAPDGRLWGTVGNEVRVWQRRTGWPLASWSDRLSGMMTGLDSLYGLATGRERVAVGGRNGSVYLLRAADAHLEASRQVADSPVRCVAFDREERLVAAGTEQGDLRLLRADGAEVVARLTPHKDGVTAVSFAGNGLLASGARDRTVKLWRWDGAALTELLTLRQSAPVRWLAFHADGVRLFVLLDGERAVRVWHLDRLRERLAELNLGAGLEEIQPTSLPSPLGGAPRVTGSGVRGHEEAQGLQPQD
jgi:WD40 repeat protein